MLLEQGMIIHLFKNICFLTTPPSIASMENKSILLDPAVHGRGRQIWEQEHLCSSEAIAIWLCVLFRAQHKSGFCG